MLETIASPTRNARAGILFLSAMSISIAHSMVWVMIWGLLAVATIGVGFVVRKRYNKRSIKPESQEE